MTDLLGRLQELNRTAAFNRWAGFEVVRAAEGEVALRLPWRDELGQYAGNLHAGLVSAMVDTACGFAAFTVCGRVLATHCAVTYLAPGRGPAFVATARTVRTGRRQVFTSAEVHDHRDAGPVLIAQGQTLLVPPA
ncbi:MAG TPA: PaaI family thioesterase [Pseudonocardia sp.]|nr:PaaI family thioesterase [Pseudonocardia sp.]